MKKKLRTYQVGDLVEVKQMRGNGISHGGLETSFGILGPPMNLGTGLLFGDIDHVFTILLIEKTPRYRKIQREAIIKKITNRFSKLVPVFFHGNISSGDYSNHTDQGFNYNYNVLQEQLKKRGFKHNII